MTNFNTLEELRTKEELVSYFEGKGQNITEEEIEELKKSYEKAEEDDGALTLQQLDDVAGGVFRAHIVEGKKFAEHMSKCDSIGIQFENDASIASLTVEINGKTFGLIGHSDSSVKPGKYEIYFQDSDGNVILADKTLDNMANGNPDAFKALLTFAKHGDTIRFDNFEPHPYFEEDETGQAEFINFLKLAKVIGESYPTT